MRPAATLFILLLGSLWFFGIRTALLDIAGAVRAQTYALEREARCGFDDQ